MQQKRRDSESSLEEAEEDKQDNIFVRQDLYVVFTHERELRNVDQVKIKISQFTGVVMRLKNITAGSMENLLLAIEADALSFQQQQNTMAQSLKQKPQSSPTEMGGLIENAPLVYQTPTSGIINLRFEECVFASKAVQLLKAFLAQKQLIETFYIQKVEFQDPVNDFKNLMEGIQFSLKIRKVGVLGMLFDEEPYGKILCHLLNDCRQLREFDASHCEFFHPKCFFDMCQSLISEKSRVIIFKLKGINISNLEGKVLQFVLMKNKSLHTIDLSNIKVDSGECLEFFLQKLDKYSNIRYLILDNIQPDLSNSLEILGEAISENTKIEVMIMRENKLKWVPYSNFWENMKGNTSLQKINVSKTDLSDRVLEKMCSYLINPDLTLIDLDLSRNQITDIGLQNLSESLMSNTSIKYLNLSQNNIKDVGMRALVNYLSQPTCVLIELSLMGNKINNEGIIVLSEFVKPNTSLKMLDISKNSYGDVAFQSFAAEMGTHATLTFLDISKSKDLNDEGSLIILAKQLAFNTHLQTLDLNGVRVRKPFLKLFLEPSLQRNITLKYVLGKLTPEIIDDQLNINIQIQTDVEPNFQLVAKVPKNGFDVYLVDPDCNSLLNMKDQSSSLFDAAFKFMQQKNVRQIDLTNMDIVDGQLYQISNYLQTVPNLRSLILNGNKQITDDGVIRIAQSLQKNNKLAHLAILGCPLLSDECLVELNKVLTDDNMIMCLIEFDEKQFDSELGRILKKETALNRAIQENLKPQFFSNSNYKTLKKATSGETLARSNTRQSLGKQSISEEVVYSESAQVYKYLTSAIKCWRIAMPVVIQIENQQLTDKHVIELCEFLKDKNMIVNLNLRRNKITNVGALAIIDWIVNHDKTLTHLDMSRNRITTAGASAFLMALKKLTRIVDFQIAYGNPIPLDINLAIGYEVVANNQIKANQIEHRNTNFNSKVTLSKNKYELIDRGPIYMRCAIKSVELLKICHLSLPDNMLGLEEAKMLAAMIKVNPPLKTLNLEINNLDANCAKLIAEALQSNDNLKILNISKNKLADLGINYLLQSLIKSRLAVVKEQEMQSQKDLIALKNFSPINQEQSAQSKSSIQTSNLQSGLAPKLNLKLPVSQKQLPTSASASRKKDNFHQESPYQQKEDFEANSNQMLQTEEIERCEMGQLKVLNILENLSTIESYKSIQTLLKLNPSVVIYFDSPLQLRKQNIQQQLLHEQSVKMTQLKNQTSIQLPTTGGDESQAQLLQEGGMLSSRNTTMVMDIENTVVTAMNNKDLTQRVLKDQKQNEDHQQQEVIVQKKNPIMRGFLKHNKIYSEKFLKCFIVLCCYNKHKYNSEQVISNQEPSFINVMFWRFTAWKQTVTKFQPKVETIISLDNTRIQNTISVAVIINQICLYFIAIVPYFIHEIAASIVLVIFLGYLFVFEILSLLIARQKINISIFNPYLWSTVILGLLTKAGILSLSLIGGVCASSSTVGGIVIGALALFAIAVDQYKIISAIKLIRQIDTSSVLPLVERSQKLAELLDYNGLKILFKKITLLPSKNSELLSQKIAYDLNPDLIKPPAVGLVPKFLEYVQTNYHQNNLLRHLVLIDASLLLALIISFACSFCKLNEGVIATIILLISDSLAYFVKFKEDQQQVCLDSSEIFRMANIRNIELAERYQAVLMREKEIQNDDLQQIEQKSEGSLFETNGSQDNHGLLAHDLDKLNVQSSPKIKNETLEFSIEDKKLKSSKQNNTLSVTQELDQDPFDQDS